MQKTELEKNQPRGKTLTQWTFPEYTQHERGRSWYFWMGLAMAGALIYCLFTYNFLFAVIIIMFAVILYLQSRKKPLDITCKITEDGIELDEKFYEYKTLKKFWIIYEPPEVKNLYIDFKSSIRPALRIPLKKQNPLDVRKNLLNFLEEDLTQEEEPLGDLLSRRLKL